MTKSNLTDCWHFLIQPLALSWHLHPPKLNVKKIINKFYFYRWLFLLVQPVLTPGALAKHVVQVQGDGLGVDEVLHLLLDVGRQQPHQGLGREPVLCPLLVITLYSYTSYQNIKHRHIIPGACHWTWCEQSDTSRGLSDPGFLYMIIQKLFQKIFPRYEWTWSPSERVVGGLPGPRRGCLSPTAGSPSPSQSCREVSCCHPCNAQTSENDGENLIRIKRLPTYIAFIRYWRKAQEF